MIFVDFVLFVLIKREKTTEFRPYLPSVVTKLRQNYQMSKWVRLKHLHLNVNL